MKNILLFAALFLCSCEKEKKEDIQDTPDSEIKVTSDLITCDQIIDSLQVCFNLHDGALDYLGGCSVATREEVNTIDNCNDLKDYFMGY